MCKNMSVVFHSISLKTFPWYELNQNLNEDEKIFSASNY